MFLDPIRLGCILPNKVIERIFCNVEAIQSVNNELLEYMNKEGVAIAFQKLAPFIKLYSLYANNFEHSNKCLEVSILVLQHLSLKIFIMTESRLNEVLLFLNDLCVSSFIFIMLRKQWMKQSDNPLDLLDNLGCVLTGFDFKIRIDIAWTVYARSEDLSYKNKET